MQSRHTGGYERSTESRMRDTRTTIPYGTPALIGLRQNLQGGTPATLRQLEAEGRSSLKRAMAETTGSLERLTISNAGRGICRSLHCLTGVAACCTAA